MSYYRITIVKVEDNPNYKEEMAVLEARRRDRFWNGDREVHEMPREQHEKDALSTVCDEEHFQAIRKAVLEKF